MLSPRTPWNIAGKSVTTSMRMEPAPPRNDDCREERREVKDDPPKRGVLRPLSDGRSPKSQSEVHDPTWNSTDDVRILSSKDIYADLGDGDSDSPAPGESQGSRFARHGRRATRDRNGHQDGQ